MSANAKKRLDWNPAARAAYKATLARIADEDSFTAEKFQIRVAKSLEFVCMNPAIGTPGSSHGRWVYAIPNTGHSFNYRVTQEAVIIVRWYRQRQNVRR